MQRQTFLAPPPGAFGRGQKVKYHLISITKSISKIFVPNFVCVLTNERYKTYQTRFGFCPLGHAPGVGLWGAGGAQGGQKNSVAKVMPLRGAGGVKNFSVGICDGAPSTARSSYYYY